jgi:hypothetical protein
MQPKSCLIGYIDHDNVIRLRHRKLLSMPKVSKCIIASMGYSNYVNQLQPIYWLKSQLRKSLATL